MRTLPPFAKAAKTRSATIVAGGLSLGLAVALGALGWFLPDAGGSLVTPTLTVLAVGAAALTTGCVVGWHRRFRPHAPSRSKSKASTD